MKMVVAAGLFAAFAVFSTISAAAPDGGDAPAPSAGTPRGEGAEIRCQRVKEVGSIIRKRKICLTEAQWAQLAEEAQRNTEALRMGNLGGADGCKVGQPC